MLEPKIQKVMESAGQSLTGGMRFRFRTPGGAPDDTEKPTAVDTVRKELQKVADNKDSKPEEIKKAMTAYRDARDKAKQEARAQYEKAQKDLREILTQRQEALLMSKGILE